MGHVLECITLTALWQSNLDDVLWFLLLGLVCPLLLQFLPLELIQHVRQAVAEVARCSNFHGAGHFGVNRHLYQRPQSPNQLPQLRRLIARG